MAICPSGILDKSKEAGIATRLKNAFCSAFRTVPSDSNDSFHPCPKNSNGEQNQNCPTSSAVNKRSLCCETKYPICNNRRSLASNLYSCKSSTKLIELFLKLYFTMKYDLF